MCPSSGVFCIPEFLQARKINNVDDELFDEGYGNDGEIGPFYDSIQYELATGYDFEEGSIPKKQELDLYDNVDNFRTGPDSDTDVGCASAGLGRLVEIPREENYHQNSHKRVSTDPYFYIN